jgi:hypothetical protein
MPRLPTLDSTNNVGMKSMELTLDETRKPA